MSDKDKIDHLRGLLSTQIAWYKEYTAKEKTGEVDGSYVYDCAVEQFNDLGRGIFTTILETLAED